MWLIWTLSTLWRELPIQSVVNPTCDKSAHRDSLDDDCKVNLYENWSVPTETKTVGNLLFSVLRWSSYSDPRTQNSWWHPSLDIVSVQWTPVQAISHGSVESAWLRNWYGNVVTIKHVLDDWTVIYSNYSHLDTITVQKWASIQEGEQLWTVWRTWFTIWKRWNHLDFQITTADSPSHPYWYHDCEVSYYDAVELWACADKLKKYTIDPVAFFLEHGNYDLTPLTNWIKWAYKSNSSEHASAEIDNNETIILEDPILIEQPQQPITFVNDNDINTLLSVIVRNRQQSNTSVFSGLERQYKEFNQNNTIQQYYAGEVKTQNEITPASTVPYDISRNTKQPNEWSNVVWKVLPLNFTIKDAFGAPFSWTMDEKVRIEYNKEHVTFAPSRFWRVVEWSKNIFITPKKAVNTTISIYYGDQLLWTETLLYSNN